MTEEEADRLYELADLLHAVARQIGAPADLRPGPCTPVEISVMRHVRRNPGTSAGAAAQATGLPTSNFSRVLKGLVAKGLIRRDTDDRDARGVRLYQTDLAQQNDARMRTAWSHALDGLLPDAATTRTVTEALRRIERGLDDRPGRQGRDSPADPGAGPRHDTAAKIED